MPLSHEGYWNTNMLSIFQQAYIACVDSLRTKRSQGLPKKNTATHSTNAYKHAKKHMVKRNALSHDRHQLFTSAQYTVLPIQLSFNDQPSLRNPCGSLKPKDTSARPKTPFLHLQLEERSPDQAAYILLPRSPLTRHHPDGFPSLLQTP